MQIKYPFEYKNKEEVMLNYKKLEGGFFPLGENNSWHGGIHLKGEYSKTDSYPLPVTPIIKGEIVAARISEYDLITKLPEKISVKELNNRKDKIFDSKTGNILDDEEVVKIINDNLVSTIARTNFFKEFGSALNLNKSKRFYSIEELDNENLKRAAKLLDLTFSNNFVLIKHNMTTPAGNPISFFSLYMHLKPHSRVLTEKERYKLFYNKKKYTTLISNVIKGVKLHGLSNGKFTGFKEIPVGSLVKFKSNILFDKKSSYLHTIFDNYHYLKVKSLYNNREGYLNKDFCRLIAPEVIYTTKKKVELLRHGTLEKIGEINEDTNFKILDTAGHEYYEMDAKEEDRFTHKSKGRFFQILLERNQDNVKLIGEKEGFISYIGLQEKGILRDLKGNYTGNVNGKFKMGMDMPLYEKVGELEFRLMKNKEGETVYVRKNEIVEIYCEKNKTWFWAKNEEHNQNMNFLKVKTLLAADNILMGTIKAEESSITVPELEYIVDITGNNHDSVKRNKNKEKQDNMVKIPIFDYKEEMSEILLEKDSLLEYISEGPSGKESEFIKAKSISSGLIGYFRLEDCKLISDEERLYTASCDIRLYSRDKFEELAFIKKGTKFKISNNERVIDRKSSYFDFYYFISVEFISGEDINIKFKSSLDDDNLDSYIRYKNNGNSTKDFKQVINKIQGDIYTVKGKEPIYNKEGEKYTREKGKSFIPGMSIRLLPKKELVDGYYYIKVKPESNYVIEGAIRAKNNDFKSPPIYYTIDKENNVQKNEEKKNINTYDIIESMTKKGIPVRNSAGNNGGIIDIIEPEKEITFVDEEAFMAKPYSFHFINYKSNGTSKKGYINVGEKKQLLESDLYIAKSKSNPLPLKYEFKLHDEIKDGETVVFNKPIPVKTTTHLGYPGTFLDQQNILHLELFADDISFITPGNNEKGDKETKALYKIKKEANFFIKKGRSKASKVFVMGQAGKTLPPFCLYENISSNDELKKFKNSMKVKLVGTPCPPSESLWLERDKSSFDIIDKNYKVVSDNISKLTVYRKRPKYKREFLANDSKENINEHRITPKDKVKCEQSSHNAFGNRTTYKHDKTGKYGDYRELTITKGDGTGMIKGWILRDDNSYKIFPRNFSRIIGTGDVTFYTKCPQFNDILLNEEEAKPIKLDSYIFPLNSRIEYLPNEGENSRYYPADEDPAIAKKYVLIKIHKKPTNEEEGIEGYILLNDDKYPYDNMGDFNKDEGKKGIKYLKINKKVEQFYDSQPEDYNYKEYPGYRLQNDFTFENWEEEFYSGDDRYLGIRPDLTVYIHEKDLNDSSKIEKLNYFDWSDFGFTKVEDKNKDGLFDMKEICANDNELSMILNKLNTKERGAVQKTINQLKEEMENRLNRKICKHPTEWEKKDDNFFEQLKKEQSYLLDEDEIKTEKEHNELLAWWDNDIEAKLSTLEENMRSEEKDSEKKKLLKYKLPSRNNIWYFHPIEFIGHLDNITNLDVKSFLESIPDETVSLYGKEWHIGDFLGKNILFRDEWNARGDALTALNMNEKANYETTYAENMERTLLKTLEMIIEPEFSNVKELRINSTYRPSGKYPNTGGHENCFAVDLGGPAFNISLEEFDKELSLQFANKLGEFGATRILFNCAYVVNKARGIKVYSCLKHHHHFHVDFFVEDRKDRQDDSTLCVYCKNGENGKCDYAERKI